MTRLEEIRERVSDSRYDAGAYKADCEWLLERVDELANVIRLADRCRAVPGRDAGKMLCLKCEERLAKAIAKLEE
jgi:hypothetical protein